MRSTRGGGQIGQNGHKLHENYKINIFGAKQWVGGGAWKCGTCLTTLFE